MTARKRMAYLVGVDPGKRGGLALLSYCGAVVSTTPMPAVDADLFAWLQIARREARQAGHPCQAWVEQVHSSPQMGVVSAFSFGEQSGRVKMALRAASIPYNLVAPGTWQKALNCRTAGNKAITRTFAAQLFPKEKITHAIADALLIAEYGRRLASGRLTHGEEQAAVQRGEDDQRERPDPRRSCRARSSCRGRKRSGTGRWTRPATG